MQQDIDESNMVGNHLPAEEISFSQAHFKAVVSRDGGRGASHIADQFVVERSVGAPRSVTRAQAEAQLLRVHGEDWELRFGQRS